MPHNGQRRMQLLRVLIAYLSIHVFAAPVAVRLGFLHRAAGNGLLLPHGLKDQRDACVVPRSSSIKLVSGSQQTTFLWLAL